MASAQAPNETAGPRAAPKDTMTPQTESEAIAGQQRMFEALSSPIRREILWRVWDDELAVAAISEAFRVSAPTISQHLAVLREAGLVAMRVDGTFRRYRALRDAMPALDELLAGARSKWRFQAEAPDAAEVVSRRGAVVVVSIEAGCRQSTAFAAFTDPIQFSAWLGATVTIADGRVSLPLGGGLTLSGTYDHVSPPSLLVLCLDSAEDGVPRPGKAEWAFVTFTAHAEGCRVEVVQLVRNHAQAQYMEAAWRTVLGRFHVARLSRD